MRRFEFEDNENDDEKDVDKFFSEEDDTGDIHIDFSLAYRDLNQKLLFNAIRVCEKSIFWKFYSLSTRLAKIRTAYEDLKKLEEE